MQRRTLIALLVLFAGPFTALGWEITLAAMLVLGTVLSRASAALQRTRRLRPPDTAHGASAAKEERR